MSNSDKNCPLNNTNDRTEGEEEVEEMKQIEKVNLKNNKCIFHHNDDDDEEINEQPVYYHRYLCLDKILNANNARINISQEEHLFISIHQTYELWFKEIIYELNLIIGMMEEMNKFNDENLYNIVLKIRRINKIFEVLNHQFEILETMTPLNFLEFRDLLGNASGFQSYQFRIIENKLGLNNEQRLTHNNKKYYESLEEPHSTIVQNACNSETLLSVMIKWLESCNNGWHDYFWHEYEKNVNQYIKDKQHNNLKEEFDVIFNENKYQNLLKNNKVRLSYKALQNALMIILYPNISIFQSPHQVIMSVIDLNKSLLNWRHQHVLLAHRIIGSKMGTGGTTGINYLKSTSHYHQIFNDFVNLSTYIIPKNYLSCLSSIFENN